MGLGVAAISECIFSYQAHVRKYDMIYLLLVQLTLV